MLRIVSAVLLVVVALSAQIPKVGGLAAPRSIDMVLAETIEDRSIPYGYTVDDVLFAARTAWSESDREDERRLVLWVLRNRAEAHHRNDSTLYGVALNPNQFSAWLDQKKKDRLLALHLQTQDIDVAANNQPNP